MVNRLRIVIDTNVMLVSISSKSKYHWIFEKLLNSEFDLFVTNDVLVEYEEVISSKHNINNYYPKNYWRYIMKARCLVYGCTHFSCIR